MKKKLNSIDINEIKKLSKLKFKNNNPIYSIDDLSYLFNISISDVKKVIKGDIEKLTNKIITI